MTRQKTASPERFRRAIMLSVMITIVGAVLISCASASDSIFTFRQNAAVDLKPSCFDNNSNYCSADTACNITINYPNGTNLLANGVMTRQPSYFNITLTSAQTSAIGVYSATMLCSGLTNGASTFTFEMTPNGFKQTTSQGINSAIYLLLMLALTALMGYLGFKLSDSKYLGVLGIFFIFMMYALIVYDFWLGYLYHLLLTGINDGSGMQQTIFYIFMVTLIAGLLTSALLLFRHWKKIKKMYKQAVADEKRDDDEDTRGWAQDD